MQLESMELPELLKQLPNLDQAEALLRNVDARGDAEGPRRLADLLQARGDLDGAEAAYRRGADRGSHKAAYQLRFILTDRGDNDGALAFQQASESQDSKLASDAQDMFGLL